MKLLRRFLTCFAAAGIFIALSARPAHASGFGLCNCAPSVVVMVDSVNYSSSFVVTTDDFQHFLITGSVVTPNFQLSLNATTVLDPLISYDLAFTGGGTVSIGIMQAYLGGPDTYNSLTSQIGGAVSDLSGDGSASIVGSPWIQTGWLNSLTATQQLSACSATGTPGFQNAQCTSSDVTGLGQPRPDSFPLGFFGLNLSFTLSADDQVTLSGSTELVQSTSTVPTVPAPEPGSLGLIFAGLFISGISARRRLLTRA